MDDLGSVAPDAIEPVIAWRAWYVVKTALGLRLHSIYRRDSVWPARDALEATCLIAGLDKHPNSHPPAWGCSCGVYGVSSAKEVRPYLISHYQERPPRKLVWRAFGRVQLWGRTINGHRGSRAQYAYPHSIALPATAARFEDLALIERENIAAQLREAYGVPVVVESQHLVRRLLRP